MSRIQNDNSGNKRIVKNTLILYLRMFLVLGINLYISRKVLQVLGVVDFGIYNVVGSVVVFFSYMNSALSLATTRFYCYDMHKGVERLKTVFITSIITQIIFVTIIVLLAETIGLWLVNNKLVIPVERISAAKWVYQFSLITTVISILSVPFISAINAHERMNVYAVVSILEVVLKLFLVILLPLINIDVLIMYGFGLLIISLLAFMIKFLYCKIQFQEIQFNFIFNKELFRDMISFTGWNFWGATAGMGVNQGLNFIINIFFGPAVNAARAIAVQVETALNHFVTNINTAIRPQIVKRYSTGDREGMINLIFYATKISFFLLLIISFPIIVDTYFILNLWLDEVPQDSVLFTQLTLVYALTLALTYTINMSATATGNIKLFQIVEGFILLLNLPIPYGLFKVGCPAYSALVSLIITSIIAYVAKIFVLRRIMDFPIKRYMRQVFGRIIIASIICVIIYLLFRNNPSESFLQFSSMALIYTIGLVAVEWFVVFNKRERAVIKQYLKILINKILRK